MSTAYSEVKSTPQEFNDGDSTLNRDRFHRLADKVLQGHQVTREEAVGLLASHDDELLDLLSAAYRIRQKHFGKTVQLYFLMNAKSGLCPEDCHYCSQSKVS